MNDQSAPVFRIDIVSDVVCPWCIVGYKQLEAALIETGIPADVRWQPFELNPEMPAEGENLTEHMMRKYSLEAEQVTQGQTHLTETGDDLGFRFVFTEESRIVNSFRAHQLVHWATLNDREHQLQMTLFHCHFNRGRDINDIEVLANAAVEAGLPFEEASEVLEHEPFADAVRERQRFSISNGIKGVPAMVFNQQTLHVGAQGKSNYIKILQEEFNNA